MWRCILVVLLLSSVLRAQQQTLAPQDAPSPTKTFHPTYKTFTRQEMIRRGTSEKAAVLYMLGNDGFVSLVSPRDRGANVIPLKLEFESSEGIAVSDFAFPPDLKPQIRPHSEHIRLLWPNGTIHFRIRVSPQAPLGEHVLKGKLKYQLVGRNGLLPPQETEIMLPLVVVQHDAVAKNSQLYQQTFGHENPPPPLWLWFLLPVMIPLILVMFVACGISGQDCSC